MNNIILLLIFLVLFGSIMIVLHNTRIGYGSDDVIVGITGDYPYYLVLSNGSKFQVPVFHNITNRCGLLWAMYDNNIEKYSDFNSSTKLYWDGVWRGDKNC